MPEQSEWVRSSSKNSSKQTPSRSETGRLRTKSANSQTTALLDVGESREAKDDIIYALQEKLRDAEAAKQALQLLVAPVEQVRSQMNAERRKCTEVEREKARWEAQCNDLAARNLQLEAGEKEAQERAEVWQNEASQFEFSCAFFGARVATVTLELEEAKRLEQELTIKRLDLTLAHAEAESAHARAEIQAQDNFFKAEDVQRAYDASQLQVGAARTDLLEVRTLHGTSSLQIGQLMMENVRLRAEHEEQAATLSEAMVCNGALASRNECLATELEQAHSLVGLRPRGDCTSVVVDSSILGAVEQRTKSTNLVPVPTSPLSGVESTLGDPLWPPRSPHRLPLSRRDYPRRRQTLRRLGGVSSGGQVEHESQ